MVRYRRARLSKGDNEMAYQRLTANTPLALAGLRIVSGLLFLEHGTQKFLSFPAGERAGHGWDLSQPGSWAGVIELVTGLLLVLGLLTRPAAFLASGTMAFAYFMVFARKDFWPANNGGDAAILFCFVFLFLVFAGPGALSLDGRLGRRR